MYITDVIWWGYTAFMTAVALFMLYFARKVQQTCPESKRRKGGDCPSQPHPPVFRAGGA